MRNKRVKALHARWHSACGNANDFFNFAKFCAIIQIALVSKRV
jgi:hypothetical protein